eukprot:scaffold13756_cov54-Attheya_sp.AAC.2
MAGSNSACQIFLQRLTRMPPTLLIVLHVATVVFLSGSLLQCSGFATDPTQAFRRRSVPGRRRNPHDDIIGSLHESIASSDQVTSSIDLVPNEGRVTNITDWIRLSDESLRRLSTDGKGGLFDRIKEASLLGQEGREPTVVWTAQEVHDSTRFAVLSHGNQTDPIYSYVNAAGFQVFRWPEHVYYQLPSRYSAPGGTHRASRAQVVDSTVVEDVKFLSEAVRVRYPNTTVTLRDAILWNVYNDAGYRVGQTVLFDVNQVSYIDDE